MTVAKQREAFRVLVYVALDVLRRGGDPRADRHSALTVLVRDWAYRNARILGDSDVPPKDASEAPHGLLTADNGDIPKLV